jgi:FKBP-type peptidyl-prolyl cis-trans isomerase FkpA
VRSALSLLLALCLAPVISCSDSLTTPSSSAPYSQVDLLVGNGTEAASLNTLTVNYTGWLYDPTKPDNKGLQFDSSIGREPFVFILGTQAVITGWDRGLVGMKIGGIRRLVIPPSLGYGNIRNHSIPPYSTLVFEIELLDVK